MTILSRAISCDRRSSEIANNLLIDFSGTGAVFCGSSAGQIPTFDHNDVLSVQSPAGGQFPPYGGACSDVTGINGNLQVDPQFVDSINGNYHLQATSPALDVGNNSAPNLPATDLEGNPRVAASNVTTCTGIVDMGAYEVVAQSSGTGVLSPISLDFGVVLIGAPPNPPQQLTFFATRGCVQVASIQALGDFQQTNNCSAMTAGNSCTVQVTFNPAAPGLRNGALVLSQGAGIAPVTATLTGQGQNSGTVFPASLNFGNQPLQTSSLSQPVVVSVSGAFGPLQVSGISVTGGFSQNNFCTPSFGSTQCVVNVTFTPTAGGLRTGSLTVTSNQSVYTAQLTGFGLSPVASVTPSSLVFASQAVGTVSSSQTVTLTNVGSADLQINGASASPGFQVQPVSCFGILPARRELHILRKLCTTHDRRHKRHV